ncbi:MAG: bifunctional 4-hydroxy-2-oxoglutarate aldolase/2-dehydro-3-deoxy-phosphogluconate aldolase [Candidatus Hydrogenedentes bacterium]|nr:bifunctional 4-hydroxy-2-oxoglutarate aldolase/2-dehydro-3-deoxy-phosphogluconate aldolase [Candidatus Hydrogenedentota bacterium]
MNSLLKMLHGQRVVPALPGLDDPEMVTPLCDALLEGGLPCLEITLRTEHGLKMVALAAKTRTQILVGAGTVLSVDQAQAAIDGGARFIVSPGFDPKIVARCLEAKVAVLPGVATATEVQGARSMGLEAVKFFPASLLGGPAMLSALRGPFPDMYFVPTGGVNLENLAQYLQLPNVPACGGTWMFPRAALEARDYGTIAAAVRDTVQRVHSLTQAL